MNSKEGVMILLKAFLFGLFALVLGIFCGAAISRGDAWEAFLSALLALFCSWLSSVFIEEYLYSSFRKNFKGRVLASYPFSAENRYVFIVEGTDGNEYMITSNDLLEESLVLKPGDLVIKLNGKIQLSTSSPDPSPQRFPFQV